MKFAKKEVVMKNRIPQGNGKPRTYIIRGEEVMLDKDLAQLYGVSMGIFNAQIKRHIKRFPADFMFQLTEDEIEYLKRQEPTFNQLKTSEKPCVFTEGLFTATRGAGFSAKKDC